MADEIPQESIKSVPTSATLADHHSLQLQGVCSTKNEDNGDGENPSMDAVQLEIEMEKKKIREEIIASDFVRSQELAAQVKSELMMEKQIMGSSDGDLEERLKVIDPAICVVDDLQQIDSEPLTSNVFGGEKEHQIHGVATGKRPFEQSLDSVGAHIAGNSRSDLGGEEVLGQAIPSSGISGMKRKAQTSAPSAKETASVARKKLEKKKWWCSLCEVSATSAGGFNLHLHGKEHKANEASSKLCKTASDISMDSYSVDNSLQPVEQAKAQAQPMEEQKSQVQPMEDENIQVQPMEEDKNQAHPLEEDKSQVQLVEKEKTQAAKKWECSLCQISATSGILLISHLQGKKHKAKEAKLGISQGTSEVKERNEVLHKWYCPICEVSAASEKNLNDHIQGKKHKAKAGLLHQEADSVDSNPIEKISEGLVKIVQEKSLKVDKGNDDEHAKVNTPNLVKTGFDGDTNNNEEKKRKISIKENVETEELEEIDQGMIRKLVKVWFCKTCKEETNDEAAMANHRKSSMHMNKLRINGGGVIVVSSILKEVVEGEKDSQNAALECK